MFETYSYLTWKECLENRKKLRQELALPPDLEEDKRMCRILFSLYLNNIVL